MQLGRSKRKVPDGLAALTGLLAEAKSVVAFTGAGVSTESGIPDFRSPDGLWKRYDPRDFEFNRFVRDPSARTAHWTMRRAFFARPVAPNPAHLALAALEHAGRAVGVITQNIDGLHQAAGSRTVVELHGTAREVTCIGTDPGDGSPAGCGFRAPYTWAFEQLDAGHPDPSCPSCGGLVKSATISFGQHLEPGVVEKASSLIDEADLMLVVGSSLEVYPAAGLPARAFDAGARLAILNAEPTPFDDLAHLVVRGRAAELLGPAVTRLLSGAAGPAR